MWRMGLHLLHRCRPISPWFTFQCALGTNLDLLKFDTLGGVHREAFNLIGHNKDAAAQVEVDGNGVVEVQDLLSLFVHFLTLFLVHLNDSAIQQLIHAGVGIPTIIVGVQAIRTGDEHAAQTTIAVQATQTTVAHDEHIPGHLIGVIPFREALKVAPSTLSIVTLMPTLPR